MDTVTVSPRPARETRHTPTPRQTGQHTPHTLSLVPRYVGARTRARGAAAGAASHAWRGPTAPRPLMHHCVSQCHTHAPDPPGYCIPSNARATLSAIRIPTIRMSQFRHASKTKKATCTERLHLLPLVPCERSSRSECFAPPHIHVVLPASVEPLSTRRWRGGRGRPATSPCRRSSHPPASARSCAASWAAGSPRTPRG